MLVGVAGCADDSAELRVYGPWWTKADVQIIELDGEKFAVAVHGDGVAICHVPKEKKIDERAND